MRRLLITPVAAALNRRQETLFFNPPSLTNCLLPVRDVVLKCTFSAFRRHHGEPDPAAFLPTEEAPNFKSGSTRTSFRAVRVLLPAERR